MPGTRPVSALIRTAFVDASAYFAIADADDGAHTAALLTVRHLARRRCRLFTTTLMVAEAHALMVSRLGYRAATSFLREMERGSTTVVRPTAVDDERARAIIFQYEDKAFSLADATSFAVMERLAIRHAFAFDQHYARYGWIVLTPVIADPGSR